MGTHITPIHVRCFKRGYFGRMLCILGIYGRQMEVMLCARRFIHGVLKPPTGWALRDRKGSGLCSNSEARSKRGNRRRGFFGAEDKGIAAGVDQAAAVLDANISVGNTAEHLPVVVGTVENGDQIFRLNDDVHCAAVKQLQQRNILK